MDAATETAHGGFRRILVATDFSSLAAEAFQGAHALAADDAAIRVVHAVEDPRRAIALVNPTRKEIKKAARGLEDGVKTATRRLSRMDGAGVETRVVVGPPGRVISDAAAGFRPDLIAAGANSRTPGSHAMVGSSMRAILRTCDASLLVCRGAVAPRGRRPVVAVATDLTVASEAAARAARLLAARTGGTLHVIHAMHEVAWSGLARREQATWGRWQQRL